MPTDTTEPVALLKRFVACSISMISWYEGNLSQCDELCAEKYGASSGTVEKVFLLCRAVLRKKKKRLRLLRRCVGKRSSTMYIVHRLLF
jgi:hypothetical protein